LGVIALLYFWLEAAVSPGRLREGTAPPTLTALPFIVLVVDIVNFGARGRSQTAMETKSQALEADALHFASDVLGSFAVIIGLGLAAFGYAWRRRCKRSRLPF
jgi:divalent metal cation (Fe/Co/Zn/Cd) transporter